MFDALARFTETRRRLVLATAVVFVFLAGALGGPVAGLLDTGASDFDDPNAEALQASRDVQRATGASALPTVIALVRGPTADAEAVLRADPGIARVAPGAPSRDGRSAYLLAWTRTGTDDEVVTERLERALGPEVTLGGLAVAAPQVGTQVSKDLARAEMLAFPLLFLFSLFVFRGLVAALLPLGVGMLTVLGTFLIMRGVDTVLPMSIYALNLIDRARSRAGDRLLAVHRLALPRGDRRQPDHVTRVAQDDGHRGTHGAVLSRDRRRRAGITDSSSRSGSCIRWGSAALPSR